jgi:hypothetical protein
MKNLLSTTLLLLCVSRLWAQQAYVVTDKQPGLVDGLEFGYTIKSAEVKAVSDKGNFSRYSLKFYVTNTTNQSKIILYKQGLNILNNVSDKLVQFNCLNATGARLTTKSAIINAAPCNVLALVEDKATGKVDPNKRFVQIGYWIKAGETISTSAIVIVPQNELPDMQALYLANELHQPLGTASVGSYSDDQSRPQQQAQPSIYEPGSGFSKIMNYNERTYLNVETGTPRSTAISPDWQSAQWQFVPVPNTDYVNIKNRWKNSFLSVDSGSLGLFVNYMSDGSRWKLEKVPGAHIYRLRNVGTGGYLCLASGQLTMSASYNNTLNTGWVFEQP